MATFEDILKDYEPLLARIVGSYAPPGAEREDLAQDVALAIWKALKDFRGDSSTKTFVCRIAHNRGVSFSTFRRRRTRVFSGTEKEQAAAEVEQGPPRPDEAVSRMRDFNQLERAVRSLPLATRQAVTLSLEGLTNQEIAEVLGLTENVVGVRLHRGKAALKKRLNGEGH